MPEVDTKLCRFYAISSCREGDKCHYSHDFPKYDAEQSKNKTSICSYFLQGKCKHGNNCKFPHALPRKADKTKIICRFFLRDACSKGDSCSFSHVIPSHPKKSVVGDTQDSSRSGRFPYMNRCWNLDKNFKSHLNSMSMIHAPPDSSHTQSYSMTEADLITSVSSVSTSEDFFLPHLSNSWKTEAVFSKQSHSPFEQEFLHLPHSNSVTVSNTSRPNHSYSALNQRNIHLPRMDPTVIPEDVRASPTNSIMVPQAVLCNLSHMTSNPGVFPMPHVEFDTTPEVAVWNSSYSTSNPEVCMTHSDSSVTVESVVSCSPCTLKSVIRIPHSSTSSESETDILNHSHSTSNSEILRMPNLDFPNGSEAAIVDHSYPMSNQEIGMSHLDSSTASNHLYPMSKLGIAGMPHFDFAAVTKTANMNLSFLTSNRELVGTSRLNSVTVSKAALSNHSDTTSNSGVVRLPPFDSTTNSEPANMSLKVIAPCSYSASEPGVIRMPDLSLHLVEKAAVVDHSYTTSNSRIVCMPNSNYVSMPEIPMPPSNSNLVTGSPQRHSITTSEFFHWPQLQSNSTARQYLQNSPSKDTDELPEWEIESSEDMTCEICHENVYEKNWSSEYKFGILSCEHSFCLPCIKLWSRQSRNNCGTKSKDNRGARYCPVCEKPFDYILPSKYLITKEELKTKEAAAYLKALKEIHCSYFLTDTCRFGNNCRYLHEYPYGKDLQVSRSSITSDYCSETESISDFE